MTYDEALSRLQEIVSRLEKEEAISIDEYKQLATEAKSLLSFCRTQLTQIEAEVEGLFNEN